MPKVILPEDLPNRSVTDRKNEEGISGRVTMKRTEPSLAQDIRDVTNTTFQEVILPGLGSLLGDFVMATLEAMLWGNAGGARGVPRRGRTDYTRYSSPSRAPRRTGSSRSGVRATNIMRTPVIQDVYFEYREDAEYVLDEMLDRLDRYGWASVGDLYSLCGKTPTPHDEQFGWFTLDPRTRIVRTRNGYQVDLPRPSYNR